MLLSVLHKIHYYNAKILLLRLKNPLSAIKKKSKYEESIYCENRSWQYYLNKNLINERKKELQILYSEYNFQEAFEIYKIRDNKIKTVLQNGIKLLNDTNSKYYNVCNNNRITLGNPENYSNSIYIYGNCIAMSTFAEDKFTVASQLQKILNENYIHPIRVVNSSNWGNLNDTCRQIISPRYKFNANDIIIIFSTEFSKNFIEEKDLLKSFNDTSFFKCLVLDTLFQRPHNYGEIFFDSMHMNKNGYKFIAETIYKPIINLLERKNEDKSSKIAIQLKNQFSDKLIDKTLYKEIGACVMNCNPFTIGHKYLIKKALKKCDFLYIFILEEDKSYFSFENRFRMAKMALKKINNIMIIPSGNLIISENTFPEYFIKEDIQDINIDPSRDIEIFCRFIAPLFGITKRFVGSEQNCNVTRQYNTYMKERLPAYGVELIELERLTVNTNIISASTARQYIKKNDTENLKKILPHSVYVYLKKSNIVHEDIK